nr:hypothetical protein Q903MT_gene5269 [Picea sitchensis]
MVMLLPLLPMPLSKALGHRYNAKAYSQNSPCKYLTSSCK